MTPANYLVPMAGIGPATSPLPRECSTTEPHGQLKNQQSRTLERETGIEPASLAWKARVLPLNYSRTTHSCSLLQGRQNSDLHIIGGGGWIRTSVGVSQQIYSLPPLATRALLRIVSNYTTAFMGL